MNTTPNPRVTLPKQTPNPRATFPNQTVNQYVRNYILLIRMQIKCQPNSCAPMDSKDASDIWLIYKETKIQTNKTKLNKKRENSLYCVILYSKVVNFAN